MNGKDREADGVDFWCAKWGTIATFEKRGTARERNKIIVLV